MKREMNTFDFVSIKIASPEVIRSWSRGEVRKPETKPVGMALVSFRASFKIGPQERHRSAHRFQIVTPTSAGTGVDQHPRMATAQLVPVGQIAFDVPDLGDSLAVWGVVCPPVAQRINVEVRSIQIDAFLRDHLVDVIG